MARCLWNLNSVSSGGVASSSLMTVAAVVMCLLLACSEPVLGDNYNNAQDYNNRLRSGAYCEDLSAQKFIEMDHIMGLWWGVEVITHEEGPPRQTDYDTCVMLHLAEVTEEISTTEHYWNSARERDRDRDHRNYNSHHNRYNRDQTRYLKLKWDERGASLEYLLQFTNNRTGFWQSVGPQQGNMANMADHHYKQFSGNVQVIKAVGNHLVLTFCQNSPDNQIFSVILSRHRNTLGYDEVKSIKNLLNYRNLQINTVRRVCLNGASAMYSSGLLLLVASLYGIIRTVFH